MALKKSTVLWEVPWDREEETEARKRAYGNYLKNRSSSGTTNLQGTASTGFLGSGQKAGRPSLTSSAAPPWELKDLGKEMQKFQNTQQTPAAEQTTSLPAVPQLSAGWEQEQSQRLLGLGREIGANLSEAADYYQNEMKPIMDQAGAAIYSESGMTPGVEAFLSPYEVSGERSYETLMYPMLTQLETQRDALWNSGVEFLLDLPEKLSTPWGMPSEDMIDNGFYLAGRFWDSPLQTVEAFIYATQLKTAYEDLEKAREKRAAAPEDKQYAAEEAYHYLRVQNLLDNPINQLRQHNQENREERSGMVQAAGLALNLLGSTAESLAIPVIATAAGAGSPGGHIGTDDRNAGERAWIR